MTASPYLEAIQYIKARDWESAHQLIQRYNTKTACWIHAHLHRIEGDLWNANYWYDRSGKQPSTLTLEDELAEINSFIIKNSGK